MIINDDASSTQHPFHIRLTLNVKKYLMLKSFVMPVEVDQPYGGTNGSGNVESADACYSTLVFFILGFVNQQCFDLY